jgi:hypothetical protein
MTKTPLDSLHRSPSPEMTNARALLLLSPAIWRVNSALRPTQPCHQLSKTGCLRRFHLSLRSASRLASHCVIKFTLNKIWRPNGSCSLQGWQLWRTYADLCATSHTTVQTFEADLPLTGDVFFTRAFLQNLRALTQIRNVNAIAQQLMHYVVCRCLTHL